MKVYQVVMRYFDGDHDHGRWASPIYSNQKAAEDFKQALIDLDDNDERKWGCFEWDGEGLGPEDAVIDIIDIQDEFDGEIPSRDSMLHITYT